MMDQDFFRGKVPMTKMEVRAVTLAYLQLEAGHTFLDIGAGTGSISVEAARKNRQLQVFAIEKKPLALELIDLNLKKYNLKEVALISGVAPLNTGQVPPCDRVFIGGTGGHMKEIIDWLTKEVLTDKAVLVMNVITIENLNEGMKALYDYGFVEVEGSSLSSARLSLLGDLHYFKPENPCYILKGVWRKKCQNSLE
ncbi:MAG: precorrin-6Y C5,15-methyltransferase (decarboxylating) subunit CbiT [Vallitaleaceae bacterium]|nr:precorrin-6Y C5,15-methyltransferase (decarboxylating) subunit CbiT [Vallitaleaceae bacterium]